MTPMFSSTFLWLSLMYYDISFYQKHYLWKSNLAMLVRLNQINLSKVSLMVCHMWMIVLIGIIHFWNNIDCWPRFLLIRIGQTMLTAVPPVVVRDRMTTNNEASHTNDHVWSVKWYLIYWLGTLTQSQLKSSGCVDFVWDCGCWCPGV